MNKKKLSVVMAGAMLASSVSPVLAATESTASAAELGMLVQKVRKQLTSKRFADATDADKTRNGAEAGKSVYYITITKANSNEGTKITSVDDLTKAGNENALQNELQEQFKNLKAGDVVNIYSKGFKEEDGKAYANGRQTTYTKADFKTNATALITEIRKGLAADADGSDIATDGQNKTLIDADADVAFDTDHVVITFNAGTNIKGLDSSNKMTIKEGNRILDFSKFIDASGNPVEIKSGTPAKASDVYGIAEKPESELGYTADYADEKIETIKVEGGLTSLKTSDLYDGLMLTTKGHEVLTEVKEADENKGKAANFNYATNGKVSFTTANGTTIANANYTLPKNSDGTYSFMLTVTDTFDSSKTKTYTITGDKEETTTLLNWLYTQDPKVDLLAGKNRYATAVSIAKEQVGMPKLATADENNIVLVNGESLVDGLAASPLAAQLTYKAKGGTAGTDAAAPILLTESGKLPKETREFLIDLIGEKTIKDIKTTIHIVGGTTVVSRDVEKELKSLGFKIERYNGANREETSLRVADKVLELQGDSTDQTVNRFVVGAEGEADAMSIAPIASTISSGDATPIIVSKKGGLTYDGLNMLEDKKVTVVGGEGVLNASEYEAIEEAVGKDGAVRRISGENRQATNAAIINTFYTNAFGSATEKIVVAKDGKGKNIDLVDALTAANLAAQSKAPIVLATNSLSSEQINALELNAKTAGNVYQVGLGVNPEVVRTVAQNLGLAK